MTPEQYQASMAKIKRIVTILFFASLVLALASVVMLGLFNIAGVFTLQYGAPGSGSKYEEAFTYPGWQAIWYGVGSMIIQGYTEWETVWPLAIAFILTFFGVLITSIMVGVRFKKKGSNRTKAILEFIGTALLIVGGIMFLLCDKFVIAAAEKVTGSYASYYQEYLSPALAGKDGGYFRLEAYPVILFIVCLLAGLVKGAHGGMLLFQKSFAKKNKPQLGEK